MVHNDLKPANFVLIGAELRLIDFGISKRIEAEHTSFERSTRCGTSNYMSPETIQIYEGKDCFKVSCYKSSYVSTLKVYRLHIILLLLLNLNGLTT